MGTVLVEVGRSLAMLVVGPLEEHLVEHLGRSSRSRLGHPLEVAQEEVVEQAGIAPLVDLAVACLAFLELLALNGPSLATLGSELRTLVDSPVAEDMLLACLVTAMHKDFKGKALAWLATMGKELASLMEEAFLLQVARNPEHPEEQTACLAFLLELIAFIANASIVSLDPTWDSQHHRPVLRRMGSEVLSHRMDFEARACPEEQAYQLASHRP